jgi:hypothetical protein
MKIADYRYKFHAMALTEDMLRPVQHLLGSPSLYYGFLYLSDTALNTNYRICQFYSLDSTFQTINISNQQVALPVDVNLDLSVESFAPLQVRNFIYSDNVVWRYSPSDPVAAHFMFDSPANILDFLEHTE